MSFFIRKNKRVEKKRKKQLNLQSKINKSKKSRNGDIEDEIESDEEEEFLDADDQEVASSEGEIEETAKEKRIRLAKKYLQEIEDQEKERLQVEDVDADIISSRLKEQALEKYGKLVRKVARDYAEVDVANIKCIKNVHNLPATSLAISSDGELIYSVSKDGSIAKLCLSSGKKLKTIAGPKKNLSKEKNPLEIKGHTKAINSVALSSDSKFLATGSQDSFICIWDAKDLSFIHKFRGHKAEINGLVFRRSSHILYSCSTDRTVKVWNCDDLCYVETLFGHQDKVTAIDCGLRERPVSCGGGDLSVRIWKIVEQSQLVFQGHVGSIDCVKYIDEEHFITAGDDGIISIWGSFRKKPLFSYSLAHGSDGPTANWISSLATLPNTDLFASGSKDGCLKIWKCHSNFKKFEPLFFIPIVGFVNSLEFSPNGDYIVAAIGREHRLGRWWSIREAKNSILIIPLLKKSQKDA